MSEPVWDFDHARILLDATLRMGELFGEAQTPPMPRGALEQLRNVARSAPAASEAAA